VADLVWWLVRPRVAVVLGAARPASQRHMAHAPALAPGLACWFAGARQLTRTMVQTSDDNALSCTFQLMEGVRSHRTGGEGSTCRQAADRVGRVTGDHLGVNELHGGRCRSLVQVVGLCRSHEVGTGQQGCCTNPAVSAPSVVATPRVEMLRPDHRESGRGHGQVPTGVRGRHS
jgi:hypothetical protein